jgi:AcrR family transcriptional regulator
VSTDDRRQQILAAAERLLRHYGAAKTTMVEIAREAAIGVGTVYLEFPSKEAIIEDLARHKHERILRAMRAASDSKGSYAARLRTMIDAKVDVIFALADEGAHAPELLHCMRPAVQASEQRFRDEELHIVSELLRSGAEAGEFEITDSRRTASVFLRAYASFWPPAVFHQPREIVKPALQAMHELVLRGLLSRKPSKRK